MISTFYQTDPRLYAAEEEYACAMLDCLYLSPVDYTIDMANDAYISLLAVKIINKNCKILDWEKILQWVDSSFHFQAKTIESYICLANEREIIKWWLTNVDENHFTVGNGASKTVWDSMNRPNIMAKYATFVEKVIVRVAL